MIDEVFFFFLSAIKIPMPTEPNDTRKRMKKALDIIFNLYS